MWNYEPTAPLQRRTVDRVHGKAGADAFKLAPNSEALLLDETAPIIWLKTTDSAGYPTMTPYDISLHEEKKPIDYKSLEERLKKLEDSVYAKSDA